MRAQFAYNLKKKLKMPLKNSNVVFCLFVLVFLMAMFTASTHASNADGQINMNHVFHMKDKNIIAQVQSQSQNTNETLKEEGVKNFENDAKKMKEYVKSKQLFEASKICKNLLEIRMKECGESHPYTIDAMTALANIYKQMGQLSEAMELFSDIWKIKNGYWGEKHPSTISSMFDLAQIYEDMGKLSDAANLYETDLQYIVDTTSMRQNSIEYSNSGHIIEGSVIVERLLNIYEKLNFEEKRKELVHTSYNLIQRRNNYTVDSDHKTEIQYLKEIEKLESELNKQADNQEEVSLGKLEVLDSLVTDYYKLHKYTDAIEKCEQALRIRIALLRKDHPDTLSNMFDLASLEMHIGSYVDSERRFISLLQIRKKNLGEKHPDTLSIMDALARIYVSTKKMPEAAKIYESLLQNEHEEWKTRNYMIALKKIYIEMEELSKSNQLVELKSRKWHDVINLTDIVMDRIYMKQPEEENRKLEEKVHHVISVFGENSTEIIPKIEPLIYAWYIDNQKKIQLLELLLKIETTTKGEDHPDTIWRMEFLAQEYRENKQLSEAASLYKKIIQIDKRKLGKRQYQRKSHMLELADIYLAMEKFPETAEIYENLMQLETQNVENDPSAKIFCMLMLVKVYEKMGKFEEISELTEKTREALKVFGRSGSEALPIEVVEKLAEIFAHRGRGDIYLALLRRREVLGKSKAETASPRDFTSVARSKREVQEYADINVLQKKMEELVRTDGNRLEIVRIKNVLAREYYSNGYYDKASNLIKEIYPIEIGILGERHPISLGSMARLSSAYYEEGQYTKAADIIKKILDEDIETFGEDHYFSLKWMRLLADTYLQIHFENRKTRSVELRKATRLLKKALQISQKKFGSDSIISMKIMFDLGKTYYEDYKYNKAIELLGKIVDIQFEKSKKDDWFDFQKSRDDLARKESSLLREMSGRSIFGYFDNSEILENDEKLNILSTYGVLALIYEDINQVEKARECYQAAVEIAEKIRKKYFLRNELLFGNYYSNARNDFKQSVFKQYVELYKNYFAFEVRQNHAEKAFHLAELCKARTLLDFISERTIEQSGIFNDEDFKKQQEFRAKFSRINEKISREAQNTQSLTKPMEELHYTEMEYDKFYNELVERYPILHMIRNDSIVGYEQAKQILPSHSAFISYIQHHSTIYAIVLGSDGICNALKLGDADDIERVIGNYWNLVQYPDVSSMRRAGKYLWIYDDGSYSIEYDRKKLAHEGARMANDNDLDKLTKDLSAHLGDILIAPLKEYLTGRVKWIISPDGILSLVPFETLEFNGNPAILSVDISYIHSFSMLAKQNKQRVMEEQPDQKEFLAIGGPNWFPRKNMEKRLEQPPTKNYLTSPDSVALKEENMNGSFFNSPRQTMIGLRNVEKEVAKISEMFLPEKRNIVNEASLEEIRTLNRIGDLTKFKYILLASHAFSNGEEPLLSSIVLTQTDDNFNLHINGNLTAAEIMGYNMNSQLVFLSACDTGIGQIINGEGPMTLAYAFLIAGNKNIVTTLWRVEDAASAEFSMQFFKKIVAGTDYVTALNETKREFLRSPISYFQKPALWGPFVFFGI